MIITDYFWNGLRNDHTFKYVFNHKNILIDFLNSYFKYVHEDLEVKDIYTDAQKAIFSDNIHIRDCYADIIATTKSGVLINIEMFNDFGKEQYKRALTYMARLYSNQTKIGNNYASAKKVISINLMKGNYNQNAPDFVNVNALINKNTLKVLNDELLEFVLIRIDKVKTSKYNENERFIRWIKLINATSIEEYEQISKGDRIMEESMNYIKKFVSDPTVQRDFDRDAWEIYCAEQKGLAEGEKKGEKKGQLKTLEESVNVLSKLGYDKKAINEFIKKVKEKL